MKYITSAEAKYYSYIEPQILKRFLIWLETQNYTVEYAHASNNEKWIYANGQCIGRFGPIRTVHPYARPYKEINATARLSRYCDDLYDIFAKTITVEIPERIKVKTLTNRVEEVIL